MTVKHLESQLSEFISTSSIAEAPQDVVNTTKRVILTVFGTALAGASQDGIDELRAVILQRGGSPDATSWVFGDHLPATSAAFLNGAMARALDYCDAMKPGLHLGSSVVPAALAASEAVGDISGPDFLAGIIVGLETGARLNLSEAQYDGFDPTGVAGVMGATAAAARIVGLPTEKTLHALALAFNRCSGSFQSNIDGSLAVRLIQGWVAQVAVECVELARAGLTGPHRFLTGTYGYLRLFGRSSEANVGMLDSLGVEYATSEIVFKKFPSCGLTQGVTELAIIAREELDGVPGDFKNVTIKLPQYAHRLVGHPFEVGNTPRVNAQFSAQYCVANVLRRGSSKLEHFEPKAISDPGLQEQMNHIEVLVDEELQNFDHTAATLEIRLPGHELWQKSIEIAPGFPGNRLTDDDHHQRFLDCLQYAPDCLSSPGREQALLKAIESLEALADVRSLTRQLVTTS